MNMRNVVVLSVVLCASNLLVGMNRLGNSAGLAAKQVARLATKNVARLKMDSTRARIVSKEILPDKGGSIVVSKDDTGRSLIFAKQLPRTIVSALYMRNSNDWQYAFVSQCSARDVKYALAFSKDSSDGGFEHLKRIEQGIQKGVKVCTQEGARLKQLMVIHAVPDDWFGRRVEYDREKDTCFSFDSKDIHAWWLRRVRVDMAIAGYDNNKIFPDIITTYYPEDKKRVIKLLLNPDVRKSAYAEKGFWHKRNLLSKPQQLAEALSGPFVDYKNYK